MTNRTFSKYLIKEYKYWKLFLHPNQFYLGRCYLWFKNDKVDFLELTNIELRELINASKKAQKALIKILKPDLFNYASLGNETRHLHFHIIPRYKKEKKYNNYNFIDKNWNKNYSPYDKNFKIKEDIFKSLKKDLTNLL